MRKIVSARSLDQAVVAVAEALNEVSGGLDIERSRGSDGDSAGMNTGFLAGWHNGANEISGLKTGDELDARLMAARKAEVLFWGLVSRRFGYFWPKTARFQWYLHFPEF